MEQKFEDLKLEEQLIHVFGAFATINSSRSQFSNTDQLN